MEMTATAAQFRDCVFAGGVPEPDLHAIKICDDDDRLGGRIGLR